MMKKKKEEENFQKRNRELRKFIWLPASGAAGPAWLVLGFGWLGCWAAGLQVGGWLVGGRVGD